MKKTAIIPLIFIFFTFIFTSCAEEKTNVDLIICDSAYPAFYEFLGGFSSAETSVQNIEFKNENLHFESLEETSNITSLSVYGENISEEFAQTAVEFAKERNIPVIFSFSNINDNVLNLYDKAYCITTDYTYAGEITAQKINQLWDEGVIVDADGNQIFAFTVIKDDAMSQNMQSFYDSVIKNIEIYGVPMQHNGDVNLSEITSIDSLNQLAASNEGIIFALSGNLPVLSEFVPSGSEVKFIGICKGKENIYSPLSFVSSCFIDFNLYKQTADTIISNCKNHAIPFENMEYVYINKTITIPAEI